MGTTITYSLEQAKAYLRHVPQAWLAVEWHGNPHLIAVPFEWHPGRSRVRLPASLVEHLPQTGCHAAICADEGRWFFDLRGVHLKGTLTLMETLGDTAVYHFAEDRVRGWDYRFFADRVTDLEQPGTDAPLTRGQAAPGDVIRIATLSPGGRPHITPIWYHHANARYIIQTAGSSILVRNAKQHPRIAAAIQHEPGAGFYPATYIVGTAHFEPRSLTYLPANLALGVHYFLHPAALANSFQYRAGLRHLPAYFSRRPDPGLLAIDADITAEAYSTEGIAGEWLTFAETDVPDTAA